MSALKAQNDRAIAGESGRGESTPRSDLQPGDPGYNAGPMDYPAERIATVYKYDKHPADYNDDMTMSADVFQTELDSYLQGKDVVNLMELSGWARDLASPVKTEIANNQESEYKMAEEGTLDVSTLTDEPA